MNTSNSNQNLSFGASSEIANPVTHSLLDLFERPSVLMNNQGSTDQKTFPYVGCKRPQLDFFSHLTIKTALIWTELLWDWT